MVPYLSSLSKQEERRVSRCCSTPNQSSVHNSSASFFLPLLFPHPPAYLAKHTYTTTTITSSSISPPVLPPLLFPPAALLVIISRLFPLPFSPFGCPTLENFLCILLQVPKPGLGLVRIVFLPGVGTFIPFHPSTSPPTHPRPFDPSRQRGRIIIILI